VKIKILRKGASVPKGALTVTFAKGKATQLVATDGALELVVAIGEKPHTLHTLRIAVRKLVEEARRANAHTLVFSDIRECAQNLHILDHELGELFAHNLTIAAYTFSRYKTKKEKGLEEVIFVEPNEALALGLMRGALIASCVNVARDIANTPGGDMTPRILAAEAQKALKGTNVKVDVLGKREITKLKMGAILGVSQGSPEEPRFIVMEYKGGKKGDKPIVFVGKGITFDTGGLSMKPSDAMLDMHLDMSGGAAVIGAMRAISTLKVRRNVVALIPSAENMVSGNSYRPGDVLTTMSGKTVDVLNTDAEGRLVLADALTYAERFDPELVVDVATLTGAALVALGQHASAVMTKDDTIASKLAMLGEESGDYLWRLPLWDEYIKYTKGVHGDLANIQSSGNARFGGAINGGAFLSHFATKFPWVHIDMAPRMTPAPGDHLAKGATGEPTALLVRIAEKY
jgi:leucyl aminopeptidase